MRVSSTATCARPVNGVRASSTIACTRSSGGVKTRMNQAIASWRIEPRDQRERPAVVQRAVADLATQDAELVARIVVTRQRLDAGACLQPSEDRPGSLIEQIAVSIKAPEVARQAAQSCYLVRSRSGGRQPVALVRLLHRWHPARAGRLPGTNRVECFTQVVGRGLDEPEPGLVLSSLGDQAGGRPKAFDGLRAPLQILDDLISDHAAATRRASADVSGIVWIGHATSLIAGCDRVGWHQRKAAMTTRVRYACRR